MFVASLNLDLFFKKVFSDKKIAKKFLEDFFGVHITSITLLRVENRMTDDSMILKFDFRCKINGKYIIIEMQQKYKIDVVKRFYVYHCASTVLQLETLKPIEITGIDGKVYKEKKYSGIEPVVTLVWMVDDNLGFKEDFVSFTTLPEAAKDFISDEELWQQPLPKILAERAKTLDVLNNKTKGLDFLTQNRIIYAFQKNIVKNKNASLYFKYFDFAALSRKKDNKEEDFLQHLKDKDMTQIINRLRKDKLSSDEFQYVSDLYNYDILLGIKEAEYKKRLERINRRSEKLDKKAEQAEQKAEQAEQKAEQAEQKAEQAEQKAEQAEQKVEQAEQKVEQAEQEAEQAKQKAEQEKLKGEQEKQKAEQLQNKLLRLIKILLNQGDTIPSIASALEISIEETTELVKLIQE